MYERSINISFPVKENILLSVKETKKEFTKEILFLSALYFYRKRRLSVSCLNFGVTNAEIPT